MVVVRFSAKSGTPPPMHLAHTLSSMWVAMFSRVSSNRTLGLGTRGVFAALSLAIGVLLSGCVDGDGNACTCQICREAISLTVIDVDTEAPIDDFLVEVVLNDVVIGEPAACRFDNRTDNTCAFGYQSGLYKLVIKAPDYETREATVRFTEEAPSEICCKACLRARELTVSLTHQ